LIYQAKKNVSPVPAKLPTSSEPSVSSPNQSQPSQSSSSRPQVLDLVSSVQFDTKLVLPTSTEPTAPPQQPPQSSSLRSQALDLVSSIQFPSLLDIKLVNDLKHTLPNRSPISSWELLDAPGLPLTNTLNKCWFHAGLHFLSAIPALRSLCSSPIGVNSFEKRFLSAVKAIILTRQPADVASFFPLVNGFSGGQNRFGQKAVPDFFEYLFTRSPNLKSMVNFSFSSQLKCSKCNWVLERLCHDVSLKLHIPWY